MNKSTLYVLVILGILSCKNQEKKLNETVSEKIENPTNKVILSSEIVWGKLNPVRGDQSPQAGTIWVNRKGKVATGF
ncbi:DUF4437 domain-containing protein [Flavivirga eckloniae]|uniref:DUF4437 domain-containing protein n=1 Tax=Flavivirga eckloniae TaxID=1803846 RepID=UPI0018F83D29|nr:DUF4437 domain-containing protein [Flavivirga eckloniae]